MSCHISELCCSGKKSEYKSRVCYLDFQIQQYLREPPTFFVFICKLQLIFVQPNPDTRVSNVSGAVQIWYSRELTINLVQAMAHI